MRAALTAICPLTIVLLATVADGQPVNFYEDFTGPGLDPAWSQSGDPAGHPVAIDGTYDLTDAHGSSGVKIARSTTGTASSFTHEIDLVFDPHTADGGTQTDFKWKSGGADGVLEIVFNSFGAFRVNHFDFNTGNGDHIAGAHPDIIDIGHVDGDAVTFTTFYDSLTDTVDVSYSINGALPVVAYSGSGIDGALGDIITNFVEVEIFKFGDASPEQSTISIDSWGLDTAGDGIVADYNGNGLVDAADYTLWRDSEGQAVSPGTGADGNADGTINAPDYGLWVAQYGDAVSASADTIPEPSAGVAAISAIVMCGRTVRRRVRRF